MEQRTLSNISNLEVNGLGKLAGKAGYSITRS